MSHHIYFCFCFVLFRERAFRNPFCYTRSTQKNHFVSNAGQIQRTLGLPIPVWSIPYFLFAFTNQRESRIPCSFWSLFVFFFTSNVKAECPFFLVSFGPFVGTFLELLFGPITLLFLVGRRLRPLQQLGLINLIIFVVLMVLLRGGHGQSIKRR